MKSPEWEKQFDEFIGRPVSGESIKIFIRELLKNEKEKNNIKDDSEKKDR